MSAHWYTASSAEAFSRDWFHGDAVMNRATGKFLGAYAGPRIPFDQIETVLPNEAKSNMTTGEVSGAIKVTAQEVRHVIPEDFRK